MVYPQIAGIYLHVILDVHPKVPFVTSCFNTTDRRRSWPRGAAEAPTFDSNRHLYYSHVLTISDWQILQSSSRSPVSELTLAVDRQTTETYSRTTDHFDVYHHRGAYVVRSFTRSPCMQMNYALRRCLVKVGRRKNRGKLDEHAST